jgi:signal peptidase II
MRRIIINLSITALFFTDLITKRIALKYLGFQGFFIDTDFFKLGWAPTLNEKMAFNLSAPRFAILAFLLVTIWILGFYLIKNINAPRLPIVLILIGAMSNLIDRINFKGVIDFIDIRFWSLAWPIFNFADAFIVIGVIWWIYTFLSDRKIIR